MEKTITNKYIAAKVKITKSLQNFSHIYQSISETCSAKMRATSNKQ